jgi:hypothetical protein
MPNVVPVRPSTLIMISVERHKRSMAGKAEFLADRPERRALAERFQAKWRSG